jgi:hypothetical protein
MNQLVYSMQQSHLRNTADAERKADDLRTQLDRARANNHEQYSKCESERNKELSRHIQSLTADKTKAEADSVFFEARAKKYHEYWARADRHIRDQATQASTQPLVHQQLQYGLNSGAATPTSNPSNSSYAAAFHGLRVEAGPASEDPSPTSLRSNTDDQGSDGDLADPAINKRSPATEWNSSDFEGL